MRLTLLDRNAPVRDAVEQLVTAVAAWAREQDDVVAAALVGSWARKTAGPGSDVDIIILTTNPLRYVGADDWAHAMGIESFVIRKSWGVLTERRGFTRDGLEVEFGIALPSWAGTDPPEAGTTRVVRDGMQVLYDRDRLLAKLTA